MKKTLFFAGVAACLLTACNNYETYGDKKDKERSSISSFMSDSSFVTISQSQFEAQGCTTDVNKGEFVYLNNSGVYMQIVRQGCGSPLQSGESTNLLVRFLEINIQEQTYLNNDTYPYNVDKMYITKTGTTLNATFSSGQMYATYGATVPAGWLVPLNYINVGRPQQSTDEIAKVKLIVPHSQGHSVASQYVQPYYYVLTFERER